jgi:hypothetical protein
VCQCLHSMIPLWWRCVEIDYKIHDPKVSKNRDKDLNSPTHLFEQIWPDCNSIIVFYCLIKVSASNLSSRDIKYITKGINKGNAIRKNHQRKPA